MPGINASLEQRGKLGYIKEVQIHDGQEILVNLIAGKKKKSYKVHLLALANKGKSKFNISWPWLWCILICIVVLGIFSVVKQYISLENQLLELAIYFACAAGIILGLVMLALKFSLKRIYFSRIANIPILDIEINKPNRKSYKSFVSALEQHINKMQAAYNLKADQQLAGEIRMLRRLSQDGIVSQAAYDKAKGKLFKISKK